jgi:hypothetical protein
MAGFDLWDAWDFTPADATGAVPAPESLEDSITCGGWGYPAGECAEGPG